MCSNCKGCQKLCAKKCAVAVTMPVKKWKKISVQLFMDSSNNDPGEESLWEFDFCGNLPFCNWLDVFFW